MRIKRLFTIAMLVSIAAACSTPQAEYSRSNVPGDAPVEAEEEFKRQAGQLHAVASNGAIAGLAGGVPASMPSLRAAGVAFNTESYDHIQENTFHFAKDEPLSTFSIDVDTASYANVRRFLAQQHQLPPKDAVRIEELLNYFSYDYTPPTSRHPFAVHVESGSAPWDETRRLVRVGIKAKEVDHGDRQPANLVFLLDVSGSMAEHNKLPLLKRGMKMLVEQLDERDRVAIVVYAGASGLVLPSTPASRKAQILDALGRLEAGGSTNGGAGIQLAYDLAARHFVRGGVNRVILATDGDFNVGTTSRGDLVRLIEEKRRSDVFLSVLGFGMGNYKDATLEEPLSPSGSC